MSDLGIDFEEDTVQVARKNVRPGTAYKPAMIAWLNKRGVSDAAARVVLITFACVCFGASLLLLIIHFAF